MKGEVIFVALKTCSASYFNKTSKKYLPVIYNIPTPRLNTLLELDSSAMIILGDFKYLAFMLQNLKQTLWLVIIE